MSSSSPPAHSTSPETQTLLFTQPDGKQYFKWLDGNVYSVDELKSFMSTSDDGDLKNLSTHWKGISSPLTTFLYVERDKTVDKLYLKAKEKIDNLCGHGYSQKCLDLQMSLNHMRIINTNLHEIYKILIGNNKLIGLDSQVFQISDTEPPSKYNPTYPRPPLNNTTVEVAEIAFFYFYINTVKLTISSGGRRKSNKNRKSKKSKKTLRRKRRQ
jgi:hypothetical protein